MEQNNGLISISRVSHQEPKGLGNLGSLCKFRFRIIIYSVINLRV